MSSLSKIRETVKLARVYVPPYVRINESGDRENVDGYWREIDLGSSLPDQGFDGQRGSQDGVQA